MMLFAEFVGLLYPLQFCAIIVKESNCGLGKWRFGSVQLNML